MSVCLSGPAAWAPTTILPQSHLTYVLTYLLYSDMYTFLSVVTEAVMSGWWWAPKNSDGGEQSRSRAVTPSSVTRAYSSVTRVLPIIWLQRCNAAKLQRGNAASDSRRFLTRDLDLKSPTYKVTRWSREPPVHSQTVPDSSPER